MAEDLVRLKCVLEGKDRLRIKIISRGYNQYANCNFPKNIRVANREYLVPKSDVQMSDQKGKFFYRIGKNNIKICDETDIETVSDSLKNLKVYGSDITECCICLTADNEFIIFAPCGHFVSCNVCCVTLKKCPMCRADIKQIVTKDMLQ